MTTFGGKKSFNGILYSVHQGLFRESHRYQYLFYAFQRDMMHFYIIFGKNKRRLLEVNNSTLHTRECLEAHTGRGILCSVADPDLDQPD